MALLPLDPVHRFKWHDWAEALDVKLQPQPIASSSLYEWADNFRIAGKSIKRLARPMERPLKAFAADQFAASAAKGLVAASKAVPQLSGDTQMERAVSRFEEAISLIRKDFPAVNASA